METLIAFKGKGYVLVASDTSVARSIVAMKANDTSKQKVLDTNKILGVVGPQADTAAFSEYIYRNMKLYEMRSGVKLDTEATANFIRTELATALRRAPYQVNSMLGAVEDGQSLLYYFDYLGSIQPVPFAAHGYSGYFLFSLMDRFYRPDMSIEEGKELLNMCIAALKERFIINIPDFYVQVVTAEGIRQLHF